ncbi:MAG: Ig-like domain-containing protein [Luteolibacter sp.]
MPFKNPKSSTVPARRRYGTLFAWLVVACCWIAAGRASAALTPLPVSLHTVKIAWDTVAENGVSGYRLYFGTASRQYTKTYDSGATATYSVTGIEAGKPYYFAVKAVTIGGLESDLSEELTVTISPNPVAASDSYTAARDALLVVPAAGVLANDKDAGSYVLTAVAVSEPAHGSLVLNADGGFTYTPSSGYVGADSFSYYANDGFVHSSVVTVSIQVVASRQLIVNGSFESGYYGWSAGGNQLVGATGTYQATNGTKLVIFNADEQQPNAILTQTFKTVPGASYSVEFDAGVLAYNTNAQSMVVAVAGESTLLSKTVAVSGIGGGANRWLPQTFAFTADSTSATISFSDVSANSQAIDLLLENVRVTGADASSAIPTLGGSVDTPALAGVPGASRIGMNASKAGSYVLERSEDLTNWVEVGTVVLEAPGPVEFADDRVPSNGKMFYRIGFR